MSLSMSFYSVAGEIALVIDRFSLVVLQNRLSVLYTGKLRKPQYIIRNFVVTPWQWAHFRNRFFHSDMCAIVSMPF